MVIVPPCVPPPEFDALVDVPFDEPPPPPQPATTSAAQTATVDPINLLVYLTSQPSPGLLADQRERTITACGNGGHAGMVKICERSRAAAKGGALVN
jgi:hypothetical protein